MGGQQPAGLPQGRGWNRCGCRRCGSASVRRLRVSHTPPPWIRSKEKFRSLPAVSEGTQQTYLELPGDNHATCRCSSNSSCYLSVTWREFHSPASSNPLLALATTPPTARCPDGRLRSAETPTGTVPYIASSLPIPNASASDGPYCSLLLLPLPVGPSSIDPFRCPFQVAAPPPRLSPVQNPVRVNPAPLSTRWPLTAGSAATGDEYCAVRLGP